MSVFRRVGLWLAEALGARSEWLSAHDLQQQIASSLGLGPVTLRSDDLQPTSGWMFGGQRQVAGRGGRVPITLEMVRGDAGRQRFQERYTVTGDRRSHQRVQVWNHPFLDLIQSPNKDQTGMMFHWSQLLQLNSAGRCYVMCIPQVFDIVGPHGGFVLARLEQLRLLDPDRVVPRPGPGRYQDEFRYTPPRGAYKDYRGPPSGRAEVEEWMRDPYPFIFLIPFPSARGYQGWGPSLASRTSVDTLEALGLFHRNTLRNGLHAGLIFYLLKAEEDPRRFEMLVRMMKAGIGHAGEPLFVPKQRWEVQKSPLTAQDMQFENMTKHARQESLGAHGVSDSSVGIGSDLSRANIWGFEHMLAVGTIDPLNDLIAEAYNKWLLPLYPGQSDAQWLEASYGTTRMMDEKEQTEVLAKQVQARIRTPNEAREVIGLGPHPDGDDLKGSTSKEVGPQGEVGQGQALGEEEERGRSRDDDELDPVLDGTGRFDLSTDEGREAKWRSLIEVSERHEEQMRKALESEFVAMGNAIEEALFELGDADLENLLTRDIDDALAVIWDRSLWDDVLSGVFGAHVPPAMADMMNATVEGLAIDDLFTIDDQRILEYVESHGAEYVTQIQDTTEAELRKLIREGIEAGEGSLALGTKIAERFDEFGDGRAETIARNEINAAQNHSNFQALEVANDELEDLRHMWLATRDGRQRETHDAADGQIRKVGSKFRVGSCYMLHPQDSANCDDAGEIILCRCRTAVIAGVS